MAIIYQKQKFFGRANTGDIHGRMAQRAGFQQKTGPTRWNGTSQCPQPTMSTTTTDKNDSTDLTDCGPWTLEQDGQLLRWTHTTTGVVVEVVETAAMRRGPRGDPVTGYVAHARPAPDEPVIEYIVTDDGYLPSRAQAVKAARGWMERHVDGVVEDR